MKKTQSAVMKMFLYNSSYYSDSEVDIPMSNVPLFVTSAGHHIMLNMSHFDTVRPNGRRDYQILFCKKGRIFYTIGKNEAVCNENCFLLYKPYEPQFYTYMLEDSSDVYWIHFTGNGIEELLDRLKINTRCQSVKSSVDYTQYFDNIISELQLKKYNYTNIAIMNFELLLYHFSRELQKNLESKNRSFAVINNAVTYFNTHFSDTIDIAEYAKSQNVSPGWFIKLFKEQLNTTPHKYLVDLRIARAKSLLSSKMPINEISYMIGFEDPLYFSRVFNKLTGMSPSRYRQVHSSLENIRQEEAPWMKKENINKFSGK